jgi:hypothetical protein
MNSKKISMLVTFSDGVPTFWGLSQSRANHAASKTAAYLKSKDEPTIEDCSIAAGGYDIAELIDVDEEKFESLRFGMLKGEIIPEIKDEFTRLFLPST